ncbi:MAG: quinolinate synthase NadA [Planctomycetota bacterium]
MFDLLASPTGEPVRAFEPYRQIPEPELVKRIRAAKEKLGDRLVILGHHYQKDEVIAFADLRGDSLKLSQQAAQCKNAKYVIFCGVHFMAETADILTDDTVEVILPDMSAGCSMADMADIDQVEACWDDLDPILDVSTITPVTYINSTAALKAFCGRNEGTVCTSSNAEKVLQWALARRDRILFFPDQHLGRNTAKRMGIPLDRMIVWDPSQPLGGNTEEQVRNATVILWRGWCSVHQMFKPEHVQMFRKRDPEIKVLVHPECPMEVVDQADLVGSTEFILKTVSQAPAGSKWAIGTELHLVNRLKAENPTKQIQFLSSMVCMCATMYRIDLPHLCWAIECLAEGTVVNRIKVPPEIAKWSKVALNRMLQLS